MHHDVHSICSGKNENPELEQCVGVVMGPLAHAPALKAPLKCDPRLIRLISAAKQ